jgi:hypothetical protein
MTRQRKNTQDRKRRVAGENVDVLLPLLVRFAHSLRPGADGAFSGHATYGKEEGPPLVRALMRVEAELLLHDARHLRGPGDGWRTPEARRADALVLLVLRTASAVGQPTDPALLARYRSGKHLPTPSGLTSCA